MTKLLLALALLSGCAFHHVDMPVRLELGSLTAEDQAIVASAADEWYVATGGAVDLMSQAQDASPVTVSYHDQLGNLGVETAGSITLSRTGAANEAFAYSGYTTDDILRVTALHEMGHLLGLEHTSEHTLMFATWSVSPCFDHIDSANLAKVCATYGCNGTQHATCEEL